MMVISTKLPKPILSFFGYVKNPVAARPRLPVFNVHQSVLYKVFACNKVLVFVIAVASKEVSIATIFTPSIKNWIGVITK